MAGHRPTFRAAWGLVAADTVLVTLLLAGFWRPLTNMLEGASLGITIAVLMVLIYVPFQAVIIISTIWAVKSRWQDEEKQ